MDRRWILNRNRLSKEYIDGVQSFIDVALHHVNERNEILCPCRICHNKSFHYVVVMHVHLLNSHKGGSRPFIQHAKKAAKEGAQFSMIDNWETLHKDKDKRWVHDAAREKYDDMKRMRDEHKEKLIVEAPEDTPLDSVHVPLEAELEIMSKTLGCKGRSIYGVGSFPRLETTKSFATSSMASKSELAEIQDQVKLLANHYKIMQEENEKLKAQVKDLLTSQEKSSGDSDVPSNYQIDDDDPYYDELADLV